uniref:MMS1_N domain-containing protein n=1 Tax=Macrostomum lignano TaxID=282301 RepID=A0A1I8G9M8_9PLAT
AEPADGNDEDGGDVGASQVAAQLPLQLEDRLQARVAPCAGRAALRAVLHNGEVGCVELGNLHGAVQLHRVFQPVPLPLEQQVPRGVSVAADVHEARLRVHGKCLQLHLARELHGHLLRIQNLPVGLNSDQIVRLSHFVQVTLLSITEEQVWKPQVLLLGGDGDGLVVETEVFAMIPAQPRVLPELTQVHVQRKLHVDDVHLVDAENLHVDVHVGRILFYGAVRLLPASGHGPLVFVVAAEDVEHDAVHDVRVVGCGAAVRNLHPGQQNGQQNQEQPRWRHLGRLRRRLAASAGAIAGASDGG